MQIIHPRVIHANKKIFNFEQNVCSHHGALQSVVCDGLGVAEGQSSYSAAERQGALEERAGADPEPLDDKHLESRQIQVWYEAVYRHEEGPEFIFELSGLKSSFIFTLMSQPVCSSEPPRCRPPLSGVIMYCN